MNVNNFKSILFVVLLVVIQQISFGQVSIKGTPYSFKNKLPERNVQKRQMPDIDSAALSSEDEEEAKKGIPPRFGKIFPVNYNTENSGTWTDLNDGSRIWELSIICKKALSINLLYDKFWLPDSAKFFIYNKEKTRVIGAFTSQNNSGSEYNPDAFATGLVYGDEITLEYHEPKNHIGEGIISISGIVHGYRYIKLPDESIDKNYGGSGSCNKNVNCSEGVPWRTEKKGVALIVVNGNRYCTGCLVNNTNQDGTPYFLTANHCLGGWANDPVLDAISNPNANTWTFMWYYESPDCSNKDVTNPIVTARATVVANNANSDFALLRLVESPNNFNIHYCGWDRSGTTPTSTVCIHHPSGDIKKITFDYNSPTVSDYPSGCTKNPTGSTHWRVVDWDLGVTEGGSSGSPLFDPNHRIIGQLHGGFAQCNTQTIQGCIYGPNEPDFYGRFSTSWNSSTDSRRRLRDWLDPSNKGVTTLNGVESFILFPNGCNVTTVQNQTFNSSSSYSNCGISVRNVTVQNNSKLTLDCTSKVLIQGPFEVKLGSQLEVK